MNRRGFLKGLAATATLSLFGFRAALKPPREFVHVQGAANVDLNGWYEVKFRLTDKEMAYINGGTMPDEAVREWGRQIADSVDREMMALSQPINFRTPPLR